MVTTRLDVSQLTDEGQQAGLVLWNGENPNTFAKIVYINKGATRRFEYVATRNGAQDIQAGPDVRRVGARGRTCACATNGSGTYIAEGSLDGETWLRIAGADRRPRRPEDDLKVGLKVSDGADSTNVARFLYFRVDCSDRVAPTSTATVDPRAAGRQARLVRAAADRGARRPTTARSAASARSSTGSTTARRRRTTVRSRSPSRATTWWSTSPPTTRPSRTPSRRRRSACGSTPRRRRPARRSPGPAAPTAR